jgi:hypothetical protein
MEVPDLSCKEGRDSESITEPNEKIIGFRLKENDDEVSGHT